MNVGERLMGLMAVSPTFMFRRWMRFLPACLSVVTVLFGGLVPAFGQEDISSDLETIRANRYMPGLSAMCVKQGRVMAQGAAGYRRQGQSDPLLVTDPGNIGSCTKFVTAALAGRLVDRGLIGWDTRVADLFTNYATFNPAFADATLDQLLCMQAGVESAATFDSLHIAELLAQTGTVAEIRNWTCETALRDPAAPPGVYSNQSYTIAGRMMELASGKDWETLMQDEIFTPLGMQAATLGVSWTDDALPPKGPVGHTLARGATVPVPKDAPTARQQELGLGSVGPAGSVVFNLSDWARFLHMHVTSDISGYLAADTVMKLQQPYPGSSYGRGVVVGSDPWAAPGASLFHNGNAWSQWASFWIAPARDFIIVVYANYADVDGQADGAMGDVYNLLVSRYSDAPPSGPWLEGPTLGIRPLLGVKPPGPGTAARFSWPQEPSSALGYKLYAVQGKAQIPSADGSALSAPECETAALTATACDDTDALAPFSASILFYQVVGVCADGREGRH